MSNSLRIVFAGTPEFAVPALEALSESAHELVAVYTQPDRPAGRGRKLTASPVKQRADRYGLPIEQPIGLRDESAQQKLADYQADVMVVVAYGLLLPAAVLNIPRLGCINIHASLLPRWRGAAPIQRALLAGDQETGVTIMQMDAGLDTGAMLACLHCPITADDTSATLHDRLAALGAGALIATLDRLPAGELTPHPQIESQATYASKITKDEARLDWRLPAQALDRTVRAFIPWPVAFSEWGDRRLRIWEARAEERQVQVPPGTVLAADADGIVVACGEGVLRLLRVQLPGGKPVAAGEFVNAHPLTGSVLGQPSSA